MQKQSSLQREKGPEISKIVTKFEARSKRHTLVGRKLGGKSPFCICWGCRFGEALTTAASLTDLQGLDDFFFFISSGGAEAARWYFWGVVGARVFFFAADFEVDGSPFLAGRVLDFAAGFLPGGLEAGFCMLRVALRVSISPTSFSMMDSYWLVGAEVVGVE